MRLLFRADASTQIGSGHVVRCLTLAEALRSRGVNSAFVCREHKGHLASLIRGRGFDVHLLPVHAEGISEWLGASVEQDAAEVSRLARRLQADALVVDHYAIDQQWERVCRAAVRSLWAIDDMANRPHACDYLLDQNLGRSEQDYHDLAPDAVLLLGPHFALLRPEFLQARQQMIDRRSTSEVLSILVSMGGMDSANSTADVLKVLERIAAQHSISVSVVMGGNSPHLKTVQSGIASLSMPTELWVDSTQMAELMASHDIAIGAAGGTSWERCCMGLPTVLQIQADNQRFVGESLQRSGAALLHEDPSDLAALESLVCYLIDNEEVRMSMSQQCATLVDGRGAERVAKIMLEANAS